MTVTAVDKAAVAWGRDIPLWVMVLARECDAGSANRAASRVGISAAAVSQLLRKVYPGDYDAMAKRVRGRLLAEAVECPVQGLIKLDACMANQAGGAGTASPQRVRLGRTCPTCPHHHERDRHHGQ